MKLFLHFVEAATEHIDSCIAQTDEDLTLEELVKLVTTDYRKDIQANLATVYKAYKPRTEKLTALDELVSKHFADEADVFIVYEKSKPVKTEEARKGEIFESISNYSFLDDQSKVLVYIELPGIGDLPRDKIEERFLERSFQVKIRGYMNRNFVFAVPKTQCAIVPENSKVLQKKDKLCIRLAKVNPKDNWYSLYKTKAVGEVEEL